MFAFWPEDRMHNGLLKKEEKNKKKKNENQRVSFRENRPGFHGNFLTCENKLPEGYTF